MARSPVTDRKIVCRTCHASNRTGLARCIRCGDVLETPAPQATRSRAPVLTSAMVVGSLALAGYASFRASEPKPSSAQTESGRPAARGTSSAEASAGPEATPLDIRREAAAAYGEGDVATSLNAFSKAVATSPQDAEALNGLGQVLVRAGRAKEAIPHFDRAIALSGNTWAYHFNRARAYAQLQEWPAAIEGYRDAARLFPDDYVTQFNLARALEAASDLDGAIQGYERAIQLAPGEADFHLAHAHALEKANRPRDAAQAYRAYLELDPEGSRAEKIQGRLAQIDAAAP